MSEKLKADVLSAFNGGEVTPEAAGRVDKEELKFATRYVANFLPTHQGGIKKWYGTSKIDNIPVNVSTGYKLIPFNGASEPLCLLFCAGNVYAVSSGEVYQQSFVVTPDQIENTNYLQINDIMYFANGTTPLFQIQYYGIDNGHHIFKLYSAAIKEEPFFPYSWDGNYNQNIQTNGYTGEITVTATNASGGYRLRLPARIQNCGAGVNVLFQDGTNMAITGGNITGGANPSNPVIGSTELQLVRIRGGVESVEVSSFVGTQQRIYDRTKKIIMHTSIYTYYYAYIKNVTSDQVVNAFSDIGASKIEDGYLYFDSLPAGHLSGDKYKICMVQGNSYATGGHTETSPSVQGYNRYTTASAYTMEGAEDELDPVSLTFDSTNVVGRKIKFHVRTDSAVSSWAQNITVNQNQICYSDGNYYIARTSTATATTGTMQPVHAKGTKSDGSVDFEYLHSGYGVATIISVIDSTHLVAKTNTPLPVLDITSATYDWDTYQWSMWGYNGCYPSKVFTYANRLGCILNTDGYGSWLQMSKTDGYDDFGTEEYGKQLDTSGINTVITGHSDNRVNWVLPGYRLYMGSYSGEYNVVGDKATGSLAPTNIQILPVSNVGGANVDAIKYKDMNLFVGSSGEDLYRLAYDYSSDDYVPEDMSFVSESLFSDGISKLQVLRSKERNLYFLTNNNSLRLCFMQEEIKTMGCYRIDLSGDILDFAISESGGESVGFVAVKREGIYTVERIDSDDPTYMLATRRIYEEPTDPVITDILYDTEFSGKEIFIKNNETGQFYHETVANDGMFINRFSTRDLSYGLPMLAEVHTLPPYNQNSKLEGLQQKAIRFNVRLLESGEFSYGSSNDFDKWYEYHNWNIQAGQEWNAAHKLMSGDLQLPASFGYMQVNNKADGKYPNTTGVAINIRSHSPEPFNLLMVSNIYV